jgi:hypothetical protein
MKDKYFLIDGKRINNKERGVGIVIQLNPTRVLHTKKTEASPAIQKVYYLTENRKNII